MIATPGNQHCFIHITYFADELLGIVIKNSGAERNSNIDIIAPGACLVLAPASLACLRAISGSKTEVHQGVKCFVPNEIDTAAIATITAIGAATFNIFLAPETQAAVTTFSCFYLYAGFIDEFHSCVSCGFLRFFSKHYS